MQTEDILDRLTRRGLLAALATAGCTGFAQGEVTRPLPFHALPANARLEPLGGLAIDTATLGFGGLSALHLDAELGLTAVSDLARWMTARLVLRDGRLVGLAGLRTGHLKDGAGQPLVRGYGGDSEALARLPDGTWLIGFERWHRIRAYPAIDAPGGYVEAPPGLELAPGNGGLESLAVLADGRWMALAEGLAPPDQSRLRRGWLGGPGRWRPFAYRPAEGFEPADAAPLPNGGALVLERRFSIFAGFSGRLVRLSAAQLRDPAAESVIEGEEVLRLGTPLPNDNFEGVTAVRTGGRTLVAVVSDDNENMLQRTLLLLFALLED